MDFVRCDPGQMVAAYTSANTYLFDLETSKQVTTLETKQNTGMNTVSFVFLAGKKHGWEFGCIVTECF